MSARKTSINLLPQNEFEQTPLGKFLKWALTFGKYIVILTQLMVIAAFLFRFKLDRDLDNLNESIGQNQEVVTSYQDLEHKVRVLQNQLTSLKIITDDQFLIKTALQAISQSTPSQIEFESLTLAQDSVSIKGRSLNEVALATLIASLQNRSEFTDINVNSITTGGAKDPVLSFTIQAQPAKESATD